MIETYCYISRFGLFYNKLSVGVLLEELKKAYRETFEKCPFLPARRNPFFLLSGGQGQGKFCGISELDSCRAARKG
jgi:hypothetical protein